MIENLFLLIVGAPFLWMLFLAIVFFARIKINESILSELVKVFSLSITGLTICLFAITWYHSPAFLLLDYNDWIDIGDYQFKMRFIVDHVGAAYAFLASALIGTIFKFSRNYLHREEGYFRFIFLTSTLLFGLMIVSFSRALDIRIS